MAEEPDYIVEIGGRRLVGPGGSDSTLEANISSQKAAGRPHISVLFECCQIYQRIYRNRDGTSYEGRCPRCLRQVRVKIGSGGTSTPFFSGPLTVFVYNLLSGCSLSLRRVADY